MKMIRHEQFALRDNERIRQVESHTDDACCIGVMARTVQMPDGERQAVRPEDGAPVEQAAILGVERVEGKWQWLPLSQPTKEILGDLIFDNNLPRDEWIWLVIERNTVSS